MSNNKYVRFKTGKGVARYPKLDQPYSWSNTKERSVPDPNGQYELSMILTAEAFAPIKEAINQAIKQAGIKPKHLPYQDQVDRDTDEPTGNVIVKFKAYGKKKDGSKNKIIFVDGKLNPMPSNFPLTSGSVVRAEGYISVAKLGARMNLRQVQVIRLAERQAAFEADDEGYEYDGDLDEEDNDNNGSTAQDTDDEDSDF